MSERSPYSRVYWTIRNDDRLATIYPNDAHLAAWLRLLIAADMAWPAPADVPASIRRPSLRALCDAGIIELLPSGLFRFHGLDTERGSRRSAAQASAGNRWQSGRDANGMRPVTERDASGDRTGPERNASRVRAEKSRAETHTGAPAREEAGEVAVLGWLATHGCHVTPNGNGLHQKISRLVDQHGAERVLATFEDLGSLREARQYVLGADDRLNPLPGAARSRPAAKGMSNAADLGRAVERV